MLGVSVEATGRIEAGPEYPQEEGTWVRTYAGQEPGEGVLGQARRGQAEALPFSSSHVQLLLTYEHHSH